MSRSYRVLVRKWVLVQFAGMTAMAEGVQLVALLWSTLALTENAFTVGVVNSFAYIPGVIAGVSLKHAFDRGEPFLSLGRTNWVNVLCSVGLAAVALTGTLAGVLVVAFCLAQAIMSVAKLANKSAVARTLRLLVTKQELAAVQGRMSSVSIVGGLVGSGLGGVGLATVGSSWCFFAAAALYAGSVLLARMARRYYSQPSGAVLTKIVEVPSTTRPRESAIRGGSSQDGHRGLPVLALVLLVSIPSSGGLQFMTALLPAYANFLVNGSTVFYSALDITSMLGGVLAGVVVGISVVVRRVVYRYALGVSGLLCVLTAASSSPFWAVTLICLVSLSTTVHVVSMQVATNQAAPEGSVGRYMAVRNAGVGIAKAVFSLAAGWLAQSAGPKDAWLALGMFFLIVWAVFWLSASWRRMSHVIQ